MATKWVVTAPSDHIEIDDAQQGQTTFTVTNPSERVDRVVFDVVAGEGADPSWFTVDEPQRRVPPSGSVSYLMKTAIPPTAKAGSYSVQGRAYSADSAPEEDSVLSGRIAVEVKAKAQPVKKKRPWWILVVAGLVVVVLAVVVVVVVLSGRTPAPVAAPKVTVPDLNHQSESQARTNLAAFGLAVGKVRHVQNAAAGNVVYQSVPGGATAAKGTPVDLVVTVGLAAPAIAAPAPGSAVPAKAVSPQITPVPSNGPQPSASPDGAPAAGVLRWTDADPFVGRWQVSIQRQVCVIGPIFGQVCYFISPTLTQVDTPSYTPILAPAGQVGAGPYVVITQPVYQWQVAAIDDFGNLGPQSPPSSFAVA